MSNNDNSKPLISDIFGAAAYGEALKIVTEESIKGTFSFISKICSPAAEEFGLYFADNIRVWRLNNIIKIIEKSKGKLEFVDNKLQLKAHPRVVMDIIDKGSWQENTELQDMWAGLLASSCQKESENDDNIIYTTILNQLTSTEVKILNYFTVNSAKLATAEGIVKTKEGLIISAEEFSKIVGTDNFEKLNVGINHLKSLQLIETGFGLASGFFKDGDKSQGLKVGLKLSPLAIILYVKCQGYNGLARDFFSLAYDPTSTDDSDDYL
ncbi:MAG: DUF4393 domain-containing protein [Sporocytophaga sp.]|uniref:Abi-alpha family protein n=1 Tax=Sporocytophaga sp. TaxID=2231183 RepID=UPI001B2295DD|nr:Abi-alpha family protein [Sporocytophaga sp.]MBO9699940.1 DUF4393 domain-containing protein [Sporocytophaga sp.]